MTAKKVLIIGAGISGLSAAFALQKHDADIILIDIGMQEGGWLGTHTEGSFFFEKGPRVFKASTSQHLIKLIKELGLDEEVIFSLGAARRYLLKGERLHPVPATIFSFCTSPLTRSLILPILKELWIPSSASKDDESVAAFIERRFGKGMLENIIDPVMQGIYAQDPKNLSSRCCLPALVNMEREYGSILRGSFAKMRSQEGKKKDSSLFTLRQGMSFFVGALKKACKLITRLSEEALTIEKKGEGFEVITTKGKIYADAIIIATDCHHASRLLSSIALKASMEIGKIASTSLTTVALGFHDHVLAREGFGYLVPSHKGDSILGAVFDSSAFPEQNLSQKQTRLTLMLRGLPSSREQKEAIERLLRQHLQIHQEPDFISSTPCPRAIPIMAPGHRDLIERAQEALRLQAPKVFLAGSYLSSPSVNDCIQEGQKAAACCLEKLRS